MTLTGKSFLLKTACAMVTGMLFITGCGKKEEAAPPPPPPPPAALQGNPQAQQQYQAQAAQNANNLAARMSEAQAAMEARRYQEAIQNMAALQAQNRARLLNAQQQAAFNQQMRTMQGQIAEAAAGGDPAAQAAAARLRAMDAK